jgi:hypothetical protein
LEVASLKLVQSATNQDNLHHKVTQAVQLDGLLRCALPTDEAINASHPAPKSPDAATVISVDGSQINPNSHEAINFFLVNLGSIQMEIGSSKAPEINTQSELHLSEYAATGSVNEEQVSLERDTGERVLLAELALNAKVKPIITLTDGLLELWGGRNRSSDEDQNYNQKLDLYIKALEQFQKSGSATAGYVDKPRADYVVRMLEVADAPDSELANIREYHPLRGITDVALLRDLIGPGERSSIFEMQFQLKERYHGTLALHFFYINVGSQKNPWLARVEIPAWVAQDEAQINTLHATLLDQCQMMGNMSYPYALHRAHEIAVVTREDREQVTQMLIKELRDHGIESGQLSQKQAAKNLAGRQRR